MTELSLEWNQSITLSKVLEDGKVLPPVFGAGNTGLINLGNTCYMNSVVQVLMSMPEFRERYLPNANEHLNLCLKWTPDCFECQMSKLAIGLYSGDYSQPIQSKDAITGELIEDDFYQEGIRPQILKKLFGKDHPEFKTAQQQDAREYMQHFIDQLKKYEKVQIKGPHDPAKAFEFQIEQRLQCTQCKCVKFVVQTEREFNLQVPVQASVEAGTPVELKMCFDAFFADHLVDDLMCNQC